MRSKSSSFHFFWRLVERWHFQTVPGLLLGAGDEEKSTCLASCHPIIITLLHHKGVHTSGQGRFSDFDYESLCTGTLKSGWFWYYNHQRLIFHRYFVGAEGQSKKWSWKHLFRCDIFVRDESNFRNKEAEEKLMASLELFVKNNQWYVSISYNCL